MVNHAFGTIQVEEVLNQILINCSSPLKINKVYVFDFDDNLYIIKAILYGEYSIDTKWSDVMENISTLLRNIEEHGVFNHVKPFSLEVENDKYVFDIAMHTLNVEWGKVEDKE